MSIREKISELKSSLPKEVRLVAVSKFHPAEALQEAYDAGQRIFGESRVQELCAKQKVLPKDIEWHFIGPLQSNKVKDIVPFVSLIHSVDSLKLLKEINKQAAKHDRMVHILLEIHVAQETAKHGFTPDECRELVSSFKQEEFPNLSICGIMGMATNTDDEQLIRNEFRILHSLFKEIQATGQFPQTEFNILSMGMSHDYKIAIEEGGNLIRIGTYIFGEREY